MIRYASGTSAAGNQMIDQVSNQHSGPRLFDSVAAEIAPAVKNGVAAEISAKAGLESRVLGHFFPTIENGRQGIL